MLPHERYDQILKLFNVSNVVKIEELVSSFEISPETARRDLNYLENKGLIKKIYGGATLVSPTIAEPASSERLMKNLSEKISIGHKCSEFINDGDSILLEIGTTTLQVAKHLKKKKNLTIITNSIYVINELMDTDFNLYIVGGKVRNEERAISGAVSMFELDHFHISKAIIGAGAVTAQNGISDYNIEESLMRKKIIQRSKEIFLVADSSKFGMDALVHVCPLSSIDMIFTGASLPPAILKEFVDAGVKMVISE